MLFKPLEDGARALSLPAIHLACLPDPEKRQSVFLMRCYNPGRHAFATALLHSCPVVCCEHDGPGDMLFSSLNPLLIISSHCEVVVVMWLWRNAAFTPVPDRLPSVCLTCPKKSV